MNDESTALVPTIEVAEPPSVHLVARNPVEMQNAQTQLAIWLRTKLSSIEMEVKELNAALNEAREHGWATAALTRQRNKAVGQESYYFKMLTAVEAGYTIIPEFPVDVFAIRVTRSHVRERQATDRYSPSVPDERPDIAPAGEGEYKNPVQRVRGGSYTEKNSKGEDVTMHFLSPYAFGDEIVFPLRAARPVIMNATAEAMALKVFDQIGICLPRVNAGIVRQGDPLIIGQILGKREGWSQKCTSFIIGWHLNLNEL